jgi:hypothetical protein
MENRLVDQATALIISNDSQFSHSVVERWKLERTSPGFTLMSSDLCPGLDSESFDVAIVGGLDGKDLPPVMKALESCAKPVLFIRGKDDSALGPFSRKSRFMVLNEYDSNWLDAAVLILNECLATSHARFRTHQFEQKNAILSRDAALGRYMLDMRHSMNNALTSVLGNSELLLLEDDEPSALPPKVRAQIDTIRNMSLRMHEIMQRFSSLEKELNIAEKQTANETKSKAQGATGR